MCDEPCCPKPPDSANHGNCIENDHDGLVLSHLYRPHSWGGTPVGPTFRGYR